MTLNIQPLISGLNHPNNVLENRSSRIEVEPVAGDLKWTPVFIWHMTVAEMRAQDVDGQATIFVALLTATGAPLWNSPITNDLGLSIRHGWNEMQASEQPENKPFEKPFPEPPGNVAMFSNAEYWVEVADPALPSDRVTGITLSNPDDGVEPFAHHSCLVVFQRQAERVQPPPPQTGRTVTVSVDALLDGERKAKELLVLLQSMRGAG